MHTEGHLAPTTAADARAAHDRLRSTAGTVVRETARAMGFDGDEYRERVTDDVVAAAHDALFASLLEVHVGTREEYEAWRENHPDYAVDEVGHPEVDNAAWHAAPMENAAVAATFQDDPEAATAALRRQAFGRVYRDVL